MQLSRLLLKQRSQTPFNIWMTQFLGGRTDPEFHYMRYEYQQAPRTYAPRVKPPGENEKLHCKFVDNLVFINLSLNKHAVGQVKRP